MSTSRGTISGTLRGTLRGTFEGVLKGSATCPYLTGIRAGRTCMWGLVPSKIWEVLDGVGVDGVGGIFPFFFFAFLRLSLFSVILRFSLILSEDKRKRLQFLRIWGILWLRSTWWGVVGGMSRALLGIC